MWDKFGGRFLSHSPVGVHHSMYGISWLNSLQVLQVSWEIKEKCRESNFLLGGLALESSSYQIFSCERSSTHRGIKFWWGFAACGVCLDSLGTAPCCPSDPFNKAETWGGCWKTSDGASFDVQLSHYPLTSEAKHQEQCCLCITTSSPLFPAQHMGYCQPLSKGLNSLIMFLIAVDTQVKLKMDGRVAAPRKIRSSANLGV